MDPQKRVVISESFGYKDLARKEVNYYYSLEEKLFYIKIENEVSQDECFVEKRAIDDKNRIRVLPIVLKNYNCEEIFLAKQGEKIYLIPLKRY